jgi:hypothetical protein
VFILQRNELEQPAVFGVDATSGGETFARLVLLLPFYKPLFGIACTGTEP